MKLAASNIAWDPSEDDAAAAVLRARGFTGIEIAPGKRWESPIDATRKEIADYRALWRKRGFEIVAMQALLFGRPDLQLFGSATVRRALREYLIALIEMAEGLGARALVFGSPKNRKIGKMPLEEATEIAVEFFREVGAVAASRHCVVCIEPNPPEYDCDFINTTPQALQLCESIGSRGIRVNGDGGALALCNEAPATTLKAAMSWLGHFHASEPSLAEVTDGVIHQASAATLQTCGYDQWVSIEMRAADGDRIAALTRAADRVSRVYGQRL